MSKDLGVCMTTLFITLEKYGIKRKEKAKTESKKESSKLPKDNQKIILKVIELRRNKPNIPLSKILVVLKSKGISLTENEVLDYEKTMKRDSQEER